MRWLVIPLGLLAAASPATAAEIVSVRVDGGIATIFALDGIGDGITTEQGTGPLAVRRGDGSVARISMVDGRLVLTPADPAPASGRRAGMLPDGELTVGQGDIRFAWLVGPTERYRHGILGDRVEASGVRVEAADGRSAKLSLSRASVFEDRRARLVDLDRDGRDEVVVVHSYLDLGAALAVLGLADGELRLVAESAPIGRLSRWLNPVGAADFDGDGVLEIAHVETPHIGGILRVHALLDRAMVLKYSARGFSNHAIGTREQDMATVADWNGDGVPDIALPDARRRTLRVVTLAGGVFRELASVAHDSPIVTAVHATDLDGDGVAEVVYGLGDGTLVAVAPQL